jgi:PAS domain S-box-containing protein
MMSQHRRTPVVRTPQWPRVFSIVIGFYAVLGGAVSLLGWILDRPRLADWAGSGISIQPNAAVCVAMSGLALVMIAAERRNVGAALGLVVATIAGSTLFQWISGISLGIDSLLTFGRDWGSARVLAPGRMGPPSSISWTLLGIALVMSARLPTTSTLAVPSTALFTFGLSLLSITGHLYGAEALYTMPWATAIALQTATFIASVSAGVIALHPEHPPMHWLASRTTIGLVARRSVLAVVVIPIVLGWAILLGEGAGHFDAAFGTSLLVLMLIGLLGVFLWRGLSLLMRRETQLRASEERVQLAIMAGAAATWDMDLRTRANVRSDSYYRLLGYDPAASRDLNQDFWTSLILPEDLPSMQEELERARTSRDLFRSEFRMRRADGSVLWARAAGRFFYDPSGHPVRSVGVFVDVTDEKRAIESLREADRRKDEFLAMLAHELRNPLAPVRNALSILKLKSMASPEQQWARGVIDRQIRQMTRLIDDLLDMSRIRSGKIELQCEHVDLARIVQSAVESSRPVIDQHGHELMITLPDQPVILRGDLVRLAQILCNLLNNAARYTPRGGLGIGLTLVKQLVELHGGTVEARSEGKGKGCEFIVRLPSSARQQARTGATPIEAPEAVPHRILIVDDNQDAAESLAMLLRMVGNHARTAHDGIEGVRAAAEYRPDVVLMDIGLPGMNGYDAARAIRREPWGRNMKLIALTGWGQETDRKLSSAAGFDRHLVKPVTFEAIVEAFSSLEPESADGIAEACRDRTVGTSLRSV